MKINKLKIIEQDNLNNYKVIKEIVIDSDSKGLLIHGLNQTGKTTIIYLIEALFGFQFKYIKKALNINGLKRINLIIEIENESGVKQEIFRNFYAESNFTEDTRQSYANNVTVSQEGLSDNNVKFLSYYYGQKNIEVPKVININSQFIIDSKIKGIPKQDLEIVDYSRLFIHSQNPEILSGSDYFSNTIKMLFGLISMTTNEFEEEVEDMISEYFENKGQKSFSSLIKAIEKTNFNNKSEDDKRAIKILTQRYNNDIFSVRKKELSLNLATEQKLYLDLERRKKDIQIKLGKVSEKINSLSDESKMKDYIKVILLDDALENYYDTQNEMESDLIEINKKLDEIKPNINKIKKELWEGFESSLTKQKLENNPEKLKEIITESFAHKEIKKLGNSDFNLTDRIKKIENSFYTKYINHNLNNLISFLKSKILESELVNGDGFESNLSMFEDLTRTNFKIFDSKFEDEYRPQGAMVDIYYLIRIYLFAKAINDQGKKLPFIIIDTPFRNENVGFYKEVPKMIMDEIYKLDSVENIFIATANEESDLLPRIGNITNLHASKDEHSNFNLFTKK